MSIPEHIDRNHMADKDLPKNWVPRSRNAVKEYYHPAQYVTGQSVLWPRVYIVSFVDASNVMVTYASGYSAELHAESKALKRVQALIHVWIYVQIHPKEEHGNKQ